MKRWIAALLCVVLLPTVLTGCSSIFDRDYASVTPHQEQAASDEDASILRAETYAELVSCVQHFVSMGQATGTVHVYQYSGDIDADLQTASSEVLHDDPLGAYALENITYTCSRIVSYYECTFSLSFRCSMEEISSIESAYGWGAIREQISNALAGFQPSLVLRTSSFYADTAQLYALTQTAYYDAPATALGYPAVAVNIYPASSDSSRYRIIELTFSYSNTQSTLKKRAEAVAARAAQLTGVESAADATVAVLLRSRLLAITEYTEDGSSSVYSALILGSGDSEAIGMSYALLCRQAGISCQLVQGALNGTPHSWNIIQLNEQYWHVDLTLDDTEGARYTDEEMIALGYQWSLEDYPTCPGTVDSESGTEKIENTT